MVAGMLMPLRDLRAIYEVLFRDGVMVAKKDKRPQIKHPEIEGVSNLQVIRAMGSLKSRGCVKETFAWRHFYWYLTNEGIVYLRDYLHLPPEIIPASLQRVRKPAATLAIAHRAARVQSVEGPTSYVPKPGCRTEAESQAALADRQGYRHKMKGPGEKESYSDMAPKFRGRPLAVEPARPKASWEMETQRQSLFRKGDRFGSEAAVMEERKVSAVQKERAVHVQRAESKPNVLQMPLTSLSSKTDVPLTIATVAEAAGAKASKISAKPSAPKPYEEKLKINEETTSMKSSEIVTTNSARITASNKDLKEEKTKKLFVKPITSAVHEASVGIATESVKSQAVITMAVTPETINDTVATLLINKDVQEDKTKKMTVETIKSAEIIAKAEKANDKVKAQAIMADFQETSKALTDTPTAVIKHVSKDVKEGRLQKTKIEEISVNPSKGKTGIDQEKAKEIVHVSDTQETNKPPHTTPTEAVLPSAEVKEFSVVKMILEPEATSVIISAKPQSGQVPQKTMVEESSIVEVKTTTTILSTSVASDKDKKPARGKVTVTEVLTKEEKTDVKAIPLVQRDEKNVPEEVSKASEQGPVSVATMEVVKEAKQVVEGASKSKRKKKKSPGETTEKGKHSADKLPDEVAEKKLKLTPAIITEPVATCTDIRIGRASPILESKTEIIVATDGGKIQEDCHQIDGKPVMEVPKQPVDKGMTAAPLKSEQIPPVPPVELPDDVKEHVDGSSVSDFTSRSVCPEDKLNTELSHMEPVESEDLAVTEVRTVMVQKLTQVQLMHVNPKIKEKSSAALPESQEPTKKPAEKSSKGRKKGKEKKQTEELVSDSINTKPVFLPEAEAVLSTNITSQPKAIVTDCPVMLSELTEVNVSPKMTPERTGCEETQQAAAVLAEAPADKREVEPALPFAEKIEREVPKPKTSSTLWEAHADIESAAPVTAEAAVAQAQASPLAKQEEPPKVAQPSASQAAVRCKEKSLSVSEASKHEEAKKTDSDEDTPSAPATAQSVQPCLGHTCISINSDVDEAAMRKKIVVVEEIVEVKQIISPQSPAGQELPPAPVQPEGEEEELDLDVLEAIAIERALLSGAAGANVQGASPEDEWDHSLEEPEEKTWPNFIEGLFEHTQ